MDGKACEGCKRIVIISDAYKSKCSQCSYSLCEPCDNKYKKLFWFSGIRYCKKCMTKAKKVVANGVIEKKIDMNICDNDI